jgi:formylglycine-generating enzyme required for sulfatase activity
MWSLRGRWLTKYSKNVDSLARDNEKLPDPTFYALSPTDNADNAKKYYCALNEALKADNDITNIALAGPYGSGKSSILKTYQKAGKECQGKRKDLCFLNISLASFNEGEDDLKGLKPEEKEKKKEKLLPLIEKSILQQLFYQESNDTLYYSRFRKIDHLTPKRRWLETAMVTLFVLSFVFLLSLMGVINLEGIKNVMEKAISGSIWQIGFNIVILLVVFLGYLWAIYKFIRMIHRMSIRHIKFKPSKADTEIEVASKTDESILNKNLDEILYFFEVTKYNVVVIEDLDRFGLIEIFVKLRELNTLIKNYKKINRKIVFIYALCDNLFQNKDRTKFFDFIIPVVPIVSASNSYRELRKLQDLTIKSKVMDRDTISDKLISDLSPYIDDMRLLHNITNEYQMFHRLINEKQSLKQDNLLAMVIYKNLYPEDFVSLCYNDGFLYSKIPKEWKPVKEESDDSPIEQKEQDPLEQEKQKQLEKKKREQRQLVKTLLKEPYAYVDKYFSDYISFFSEGKMSNNGIFLRNVEYHASTELDHPLSEIDSLLKEIDIKHFDKEYILNYSLVIFLLEYGQGAECVQQVETLFAFLSTHLDFVAKLIVLDGNSSHTQQLLEKVKTTKKDLLIDESINPFSRCQLFFRWKDELGLSVGEISQVRRMFSGVDLIDMVKVEGGRFRRFNRRGKATVSDFRIGKYTVTQAEWAMVMDSNPSYNEQGGKYPVEMVSWNDVQEYCKRLNFITGKEYRLPTEDEWEYAARGGNKSKGYKYSGSNILDEVGWYWENSDRNTHPVGQKKANELGIYDMSGNVWEWCEDKYDERRSFRVSRGGSWNYIAKNCRSAARHSYDPGDRNIILGFRVAASASF